MELRNTLLELATHIPRQLPHVQTKAATLDTLVLPFIQALGYNTSDSNEVVPRFTVNKRANQDKMVDFAISVDGTPMILVECRHHTMSLDRIYAPQLYTLFGVTDARFGILTNGLVYWLFTDLESPYRMDERPFFEFNVLTMREPTIALLTKLSKSAFDLDSVLIVARRLKYQREIGYYVNAFKYGQPWRRA